MNFRSTFLTLYITIQCVLHPQCGRSQFFIWYIAHVTAHNVCTIFMLGSYIYLAGKNSRLEHMYTFEISSQLGDAISDGFPL